MTIRDAIPADCDAVLALWRLTTRPSPTDTAEDVHRFVAASPGLFLVADAGGDVVGTVLGGWDHWRGHVYRLAVHPAHRRRGVARALATEIERRLHARGARSIHALAISDLGERFWTALGYDRTSDVDFARR